MQNAFVISDFHYLIFPTLLLVYYLVSWLAVGRDPKIGNVAPQYEPPAGISPGVARYIVTGGTDGTSLAAVLAELAAKGVVSIEPQSRKYEIKLLDRQASVLPDEASVVKTLFNVALAVQPYATTNTAVVGSADRNSAGSRSRTNWIYGPKARSSVDQTVQEERSDVVVDPTSMPEIGLHIEALQDTFRKNLEGIYFRQNFRYAGIGILATYVWGLATAFTLNTQSSMFITFWLLLFTTLSGLVIGGVWTSTPSRPTANQRIGRIMLPLLFFGLPGVMIYFAFPTAHSFVLALLLSVLLNDIFFVIMRAPTPRGLAALQHLAGFREFLVRVEQDRLDRLNTPQERAELMNRFLPYAVALEVREGWGDTMASAFSDALVAR